MSDRIRIVFVHPVTGEVVQHVIPARDLIDPHTGELREHVQAKAYVDHHTGELVEHVDVEMIVIPPEGEGE